MLLITESFFWTSDNRFGWLTLSMSRMP